MSTTSRVLVVDDSAFMRQIICDLIEADSHFTVIATANNGREAIDAVRLHKPDIITMDLEMPEMNGLEATGEIRRREEIEGTHVPIVGVTAHALKGDRERCIEAGMDDYLPKPISPKALAEKVERWLGGATAAQLSA